MISNSVKRVVNRCAFPGFTVRAVASPVGWGEHREPQRLCTGTLGVHFVQPNLRADLARIKSGAASLASENIKRSGNDELVARSSNGLITAILSISAESKIEYNSLLTMESIWTDFLEKAASNNPIALKYLASELEGDYSAPANFQILTKIKAIQKDFDFIEINEEFARLAVAVTSGGKDYLHYVSFEKKPTGWRIAGF